MENTRTALLNQLANYFPEAQHEQEMLERMKEFVSTHEDCFLRSNLLGQVTGSAWIMDADMEKVLLVYHRKLEKWLQPGGHSDGDADILRVALKEAQEETGLTSVRPFSESIFDVDVHEIPERKGVPAHHHYDIRYRLIADPSEPLQINHESLDLKWVLLTEVAQLNAEESVVRMVDKILKIKGI